ncbi:ArnT family glycosyltransferase [Ulvibacterium sp.]|uniref:ArnT family glycosyltransferase n=1 Tax=Ulvibacterium sp. TaxID=2665914 RepID=UPI003BAAEA93
MLRKVITSLTPKYHKLKDKSVFLLLFATSFFIRFPFFFRDYIDRDESTFILMGQSWVDGYLPYVELWDLKPPITYLFFASSIYIFGKSFLAIRFLGTLVVAITAFFTYKIGKEMDSKKLGFWAAMACIALQSLFGSLQGVMSEHICMTFFMPGLYLLIKHERIFWSGLSGILMGLAMMTKLNMAYAVLLLGIYVLYRYTKQREYNKAIRFSFFFAGGIVTVVLLTLMPYFISGSMEVWWKSVILAPLEYTDARRYSVLKMAPTFLLLGLFFYYAWKKKLLDFRAPPVQILTIAILGVLLSFIKGGRINSHYLIQLHPILIIVVGMAVGKIPIFQKFDYRPYLFFLTLVVPLESYLEYYAVVRNKIERGTFFNGEGFTVPQYLVNTNTDTQNILFLGYHIGYWVLDAKPPTKAATHPSNICRDELFPFYDNPRSSSLQELQYIFEEIRPKVIVVRKNRLVFDKKEVEENEYVDAYLEKYYTVFATIDKAEILQRSH